jgi:hypothetical protein
VALFLPPGGAIEVRSFGTTEGTLSGGFDDPGRLVAAISELDVVALGAAGLYCTANPVNPALLTRAPNTLRVIGLGEGAGNGDIVARRWFLIDFDPVRLAGISSTEAEHNVAISRARECQGWLVESLGFPLSSMVLADSGNGAHLTVHIDLPNDAASATLLQHCLKALDTRFSDSQIKVDPAVWNAGRIWKLPGTWARKGPNTPERPHRLAHILEGGEALTLAPPELLAQLAALVPEEKPKAHARPCPHRPLAKPRGTPSGDIRPGDDFAAQTPWEAILEPHGWQQVYARDGEIFWRRPGKDRGVSASTNFAGTDLFYCFSTSTDFEANRGYGKFSAFAALNYDNDFAAAARDLATQGYGTHGHHTGHNLPDDLKTIWHAPAEATALSHNTTDLKGLLHAPLEPPDHLTDSADLTALLRAPSAPDTTRGKVSDLARLWSKGTGQKNQHIPPLKSGSEEVDEEGR